jgi:putative endonuclease
MRILKGKSGEDKAAAFLRKKGYAVIKRNYRAKTGEIDIIAEKDGTLVFVEVKTRSTDAFGEGYQSVTHTKQDKIIRTAEFYLMENNMEKLCRFDVISIDNSEITHIINAFGA